MSRIILNHKGKKLPINIRECNIVQMARGLMFRKRENAQALLFNVKKPIALHSFFVFFPVITIWLNKNNKIVEIKKVKPFTFHIKPKKEFNKVIEIPINKKYEKILKEL